MPSVSDLRVVVRYFEEPCFSPDDLLDAFAVYDYLGLREDRRGNECAIFERHADIVRNAIDAQQFNDAKDRAGIGSAFDLRDLGRALIAVEFPDM